MKRRREQERDEAIAHEQADARRESLLAALKARQAGGRAPEPPPATSEPDVEPDGEPDVEADVESAAGETKDESAESARA
jgi:hypothetical protein